MSMRDLPKAEVSAKPGIRSDVNVKALQRWNPDVRSPPKRAMPASRSSR